MQRELFPAASAAFAYGARHKAGPAVPLSGVWGERAHVASIYGRVTAVLASIPTVCRHPFCGVLIQPGEVYALCSLHDVLLHGPTRLCAACGGLTIGEGGRQ